jgi:futalosine hydrolase
MRILICAAEHEELITARQAFNSLSPYQRNNLDITWVTTGIGTTSTSYRITKALLSAEEPFDLAINCGIAGSFTKDIPLGKTARITKEFFGDLGFETFSGFQTLFDYKILDANTFPFKNGAMLAPLLPDNMEEALKGCISASAVTVQTVSGLPEKKERLFKDFNPQIESMEGAAFFYVCLLEEIPFVELRSVSNEVGERDRSKWDIPSALSSMKNAISELLQTVAI